MRLTEKNAQLLLKSKLKLFGFDAKKDAWAGELDLLGTAVPVMLHELKPSGSKLGMTLTFDDIVKAKLFSAPGSSVGFGWELWVPTLKEVK